MLGFKKDDKDMLRNRRRFMVFMTIYAILWGFTILICDLLFKIETAKVVAYLGFISTLSGAGLFAYFSGANKAENKTEMVDREDF